MTSILKCENVCVDFPIKSGFLQKTTSFVHAVKNISFEIHQGHCLGLVGESGSGKSSLGLALLGFNPISAGKILYQGQEIKPQDWPTLRSKIQVIFQDSSSSLNPKRTIGEQLADPLLRHQIVPTAQIKERSVQLLEQVGLDADFLERFPFSFSGGQRQRINIARALACEPEFLLCDEVTSALDVRTQASVLALLQKLQSELNLTMLFISHDLAVIQQISQEILVMQNGNCMEYGTTQEILQNPQHSYTQQLIQSVPKLRRFHES